MNKMKSAVISVLSLNKNKEIEVESKSESENELEEEFESGEESELIDTIYENQVNYLKSLDKLSSIEYEDYSIDIFKMNGNQLIKLNPMLYKDQRICSIDHVDNIAKHLTGRKVFHHNIILVHNLYSKTIEIYDGQHRIESLKKKGELTRGKIDCFVHIYTLNTDDEDYLQKLYDEINVVKGNTVEEKYDQKYAGQLAREMQKRFGTYYSTSLKIVDLPKDELKYDDRWRLSYHELKKEFEKRQVKLKGEDLYKKLEEFNKKCKRECLDENGKLDDSKINAFFKKYKINNKIVKEKCLKYEFFLGIALNDIITKL